MLDSLFCFVGVLTPDGLLIDANRTALAAAHLDLADMLDQPFDQTYWWSYSPAIQAQLRAAIAQAAQGETVRYDVQVRLGPDQFVIIDFALVPLVDADGRVECLIPSGIDVTDRKRAEAELRDSQAQLQRQLAELEVIYQTAPVGLTLLDRDLRFVRINERLAEINGPPVEAHIGCPVRELLPDLAETAESLLRPVLETGEPLMNVEIQGETPAQPGVSRTWIEHFLPLKQGDRVVGISIVCEEVTEQKRQERDRQQREAALQAAVQKLNFHFENTPLAVIEWDQDLRIRRWSQSAEQIFGWTAAAVRGKRFDEIPLIHEADLGAVLQAARQFVDGTSSQFALYNRNYTRSGEIIHCEWYNSALLDESGTMQSALSLVLDVTDRMQAQQELHASELRFRLMAENIQDVFWMTDFRNAQILYVSPAFETIWGRSPEVVCQSHAAWIETLHPEDRDRVVETAARCRDTNQVEQEYRIIRPDGEIRWIRDRGFALRDETGEIQHTVGIAQDITPYKQIELQLQQTAERLALALRSAPITLFNQDRDLRYTWIYNPQLGHTAEAVLGCQDVDLASPAVAAYLTQLKRQVLETGVSLRETVPIDQDGQLHYFDLTIDPLWDDHAQIVGITCAAVNISDRIQAEAALRNNEQLLRLALQGANAGSWDWEITTGKITWSPENCDLYGLDRTQPTPRYEDWYNAIHPEDREQANQAVLQVVEQRLPNFYAEFRIVHPQRGIRWLLGLGRLIVDTQGTPLRLSGINLDITARKQAEDRLRDSEERLRMGMQVAGFAMARFDYPTNTVELSQEAAAMYGLPVHELVVSRDRIHATFHPDDRAELAQLIQQVTDPAGPGWFARDHRILWPNGEVRWLSVRKQVFFDRSGGGGQPSHAILVALDITHRKQAELALRQSEERYRTLFETMEDGFCILQMIFDEHQVPVDYRFLEVNPAFEKHTGLQQAQGKTARQLLPTLEDHWFEVYSQVALTREPVRFENGSAVMNRWFEVYAFPVDSPESYKVALLFKDISSRKRAENALAANEARLRSFVEANVVGILYGDIHGNIYHANDELLRIVGYTRADLEAGLLRWIDMTPPEWREADRQGIAEAQARGACTPYEKEYIRQDGRRVPVLVGYSLVGDEQEESVAFILDLSDTKRVEAQLSELLQREQAARAAAEQANRIKDEFLAVLSHELRTPLNPILGWARILQTRKLDPERTAQALATIERNVKLQTQLIDDLLDVARILRGKLKIESTAVSLAYVIGAAIETVNPAASAKAIAVQFVQADGTPIDTGNAATAITDLQVSGDPARLQQIVWNLLSNAIKFTPTGGQVWVRLASVGDQAQIAIQDTGIGIRSDFLPHLFEAFRQEDASITRRFGGLGLGLSIVRYLVEAHGGTIQADSPGEGLGATFTVQLPRLRRAIAAAPPQRAAANLDLSRLHVMVVDDEPDTLEMLTVSLTLYGATVTAVPSAPEALMQLASCQADLLISDIGMPEMDGYTLIQEIRRRPLDQGGQIPAIALTAYARHDDQQRALASGYQRHLAKPVDVEVLINLILDLLPDRVLS